MGHHPFELDNCVLNRRDFLQRTGMGFGALGLSTLLGGAGLVGREPGGGVSLKRQRA